MHIYIYDNYINNKKFDGILAQIETRITDLGLNGKIIRLGIMKNIQEAVENELKRGAKTIVAVGNNITINNIINALVKVGMRGQLGLEVPLGIIPVGEENNSIAFALGIKPGVAACDFLSARRIEKLDIAQINNDYFLSQAEITSQGTILKIDKDYSIEITEPGAIDVINLSTFADLPENIKPNPQDGQLELYIKTKKVKKYIKLKTGLNQSFFPIKKLTIFNPKASVIIDHSLEIKTPADINVLRKKLNIIIGKERSFLIN